MVLKIEKEVQEIPQEVGVHQGTGPVSLFYDCICRTLEIKWKHEKIEVVTVMTAADKQIQKGQLCSHTPKMFKSKILSAYKIFQSSMLTTELSLSTQGAAYQKAWGLLVGTLYDLALRCILGGTEASPRWNVSSFRSSNSSNSISYRLLGILDGKLGA